MRLLISADTSGVSDISRRKGTARQLTFHPHSAKTVLGFASTILASAHALLSLPYIPYIPYLLRLVSVVLKELLDSLTVSLCRRMSFPGQSRISRVIRGYDDPCHHRNTVRFY